MAAGASSTVARGKILLKAQEVTFAKALAGNNLVFRDRAVRRLKKWFEARSKGKFRFEEDDLMRVWKGLYHCMWMSDKPLVQEALSEQIASLIHSFVTPEQMTLFIRCFYQTMINEWSGIDQLRLDKYLMLIRRVLRQSLEALRRLDWAPSSLELYNSAMESTVFSLRELVPIGLVSHYCSIFLEELAKIGGTELPGPVASQLLPPIVALWAESRSAEVRKMVMRFVLDPLIAQSPIMLREDARFRAWAKAGYPGKSMYSMELVEDEDQEGEPADGEEAAEEAEIFDGLDPRAGSADVVLNPITFDAGLVADLFKKHLAGKVGRVHVSINRQHVKFTRLAKGLDPISKRHRVQLLRDLPLMREHEKWRCARKWESAFALAEFDSEEDKASKTGKKKYQGETNDEIFADFVSKHANKNQKRLASGEITADDSDLANKDVTNGDTDRETVAKEHQGRAKKQKLSGEWTVTTENGHEDAATPMQQTTQQTSANKAGKQKSLKMADTQSPLVSSKKQEQSKEPNNKQTPSIESAKKKTPLVQASKKPKLSEEAIQEQNPAIESAKKKKSLEIKEQTPLVRSTKKQKLSDKSVKNQTPSVESSEKKTLVETAKQTPLVSSTKKQKLSEESIQEQTTSIESTTKKTPIETKKQKRSLNGEPAVEESVAPMTPVRDPKGGRRKLFSPSVNHQLMSSPPVEVVEEPLSPAMRHKLLSPEREVSGSVGEKLRRSFSAAIESYKKVSQTTASPSITKAADSAKSVAPLSIAKENNEQKPKPAVEKKPTIGTEAGEPDSNVSNGHTLCLNVIQGTTDAVTKTKRQSLVPGSPSRTSLRIAQKTPLGKNKTSPQQAVPKAVETLRSSRASLGSPGGTKRVNIALSRNEAQEVWEYHAALESSPGIPFDAARRPTESALKPGAVPSPVNPFYRRPKFLT